jgi:hypothetical protein
MRWYFCKSDRRLSVSELTAVIAERDRAQRACEQIGGELSVARLQLARIDEELIGSYGEIETMPAKELRRILRNIAYIVSPATQAT